MCLFECKDLHPFEIPRWGENSDTESVGVITGSETLLRAVHVTTASTTCAYCSKSSFRHKRANRIRLRRGCTIDTCHLSPVSHSAPCL